jgi:hypothetical protein
MSDERRQSYRYPVPTDQEAAILRTRKTDVFVRVIEESAGGFGVTTRTTDVIQVGQVVSLGTSAGCCEVRVMSVAVDEEKKEARIGLKRLRDIPALRRGGWRELFSGWRYMFTPTSLVGIGLVVGICAVIYVTGMFGPVQLWPDHWSNFGGRSGSSRDGDSTVASSGNPRQIQEHQLAMNYLKLDGLKSRKLAEELNLNEQQQKKINGIIEDTTAALAALYENRSFLSTKDWSDVGMQLMQASWQQIRDVLTDEQKARWNAMLEEPAATPPKSGKR